MDTPIEATANVEAAASAPAPAPAPRILPAEVQLPEVNRLRVEVIGVELASRRAATRDTRDRAQSALDALTRLDLDYRRDRARLEQEAAAAKTAFEQAQAAEKQVDARFGVVFSGQMQEVGIPADAVGSYTIDVNPSMRITRIYDPRRVS